MVIQKINTSYRSFIWTWGNTPSRKSPVGWEKLSKPIKQWGLNILNLEISNQITVMKLFWNLRWKQDCLWVKWTHSYFLKEQHMLTMDVNKNASWIIKSIMKDRNKIHEVQSYWESSLEAKKFSMGTVYKLIHYVVACGVEWLCIEFHYFENMISVKWILHDCPSRNF